MLAKFQITIKDKLSENFYNRRLLSKVLKFFKKRAMKSITAKKILAKCLNDKQIGLKHQILKVLQSNHLDALKTVK